jgi:hypothetical protein
LHILVILVWRANLGLGGGRFEPFLLKSNLRGAGASDTLTIAALYGGREGFLLTTALCPLTTGETL